MRPSTTFDNIPDDGFQRRIIRRWLTGGTAMAILFCVFWNGSFVLYYWIAFSKPGTPLLVFFFPLPHVAVGIWMVYYILASLVNNTIVQVKDNLLTVRHGPVPYYGNRSVEASSIVQIFCVENRMRKPVSYDVNALMTDGSSLKLLGSLERDQALFYEEQLEEWLDIEPQPVRGEVGQQ
jgi:hypothetical protein